MIYSIGYQNTPIPDLIRIIRRLNITLVVDVRSVPYTRRPDRYEFNKNRLQKRFADDPSFSPLPASPLFHGPHHSGCLYIWKGDVLGGKFGEAKEEGIVWLVQEARTDNILLLLCLEDDPSQCHRRYDIARRLLDHGIDVIHLYQGKEKRESHFFEEALHV
jgi:hypothetical protein